jgi:hypothetical protein
MAYTDPILQSDIKYNLQPFLPESAPVSAQHLNNYLIETSKKEPNWWEVSTSEADLFLEALCGLDNLS